MGEFPIFGVSIAGVVQSLSRPPGSPLHSSPLSLIYIKINYNIFIPYIIFIIIILFFSYIYNHIISKTFTYILLYITNITFTFTIPFISHSFFSFIISIFFHSFSFSIIIFIFIIIPYINNNSFTINNIINSMFISI